MCFVSRFLDGLTLLALSSGIAVAAPFAYVTNFASNDVSVIDTATDTVVATIPVGSSPFGVAVNPAGTRVYVTDSTGVSVIDAATNTVVAVVAVPGGRGIAVNQAGTRVYTATVFPFPGIAVIDAATNTVVAKVATSDVCWGVAVNAGGTRVYATNEFANTVSVIDAATNSLITAVKVGRQPQGIVVNPAGTRVYVTNINDDTISVIDTATNTVIASVPSANVDLGITVNPSGTQVYVTNSPGNISVLDTATNTLVALYGVLGFNLAPQGISVTPDGKRVYVVNLQSGNVSVIDTTTNAAVATVKVGSRPVAFGQFIGPAAAAPPAPNFQGLWWIAQESGWGINLAHQGDIIFATWFTYGADNKSQWYTIRAQKAGNSVFSGPVSTFTGPPFNSVPFPANVNVKTEVGTATITFAGDGKSAAFNYTVNGITQTKQIVPQQFAPGVPIPACVWGAQPDLTLATNYQDLWWVTNGDEAGWGVNFTHQGNVIFATWFTYDANGKAWWLFVVATETAVPKVYTGLLKVATGPPFSAEPFDQNAVVRTTVGSATITIIDGNHAKFDYSLNGVTQSKNLARQVFAPPGTVCQ